MIYDEHHIHMNPEYASQLIQEDNYTGPNGKKYSLDEILAAVWHAGFSQGWDSATYALKSNKPGDTN